MADKVHYVNIKNLSIQRKLGIFGRGTERLPEVLYSRIAGKGPVRNDAQVRSHLSVAMNLARSVARYPADGEGGKKKETQSERLVNITRDLGVDLFHDPDGCPYATVPVDRHRETWAIGEGTGGDFRNWLSHRFHSIEGKVPGGQAMADALVTLRGMACFDGDEHPVWTRLAELEGAIYLDLADDAWRAVEITADGWKIVGAPPVKFVRSPAMRPLPDPEPGGSLDALRDLLNIGTEENWRLVVAWLVQALRPTGPYPILVVYGEH